MNGFSRFVQYHNAVPIAFSILLLGAGGAFAATNPEAIYSATQGVISIDNTYIANKNLDAYTPQVRITGVTEDEEYYYVAYDFTTIDLADYVWQDTVKKEMMKVSKADLGPYRDLGLYVMAQLKQKIDREIAYLKEVQDIEKRSISQKMVATAYGGLIGQFLDEKTDTLPGYTPVVTPPAPPESGAGSIASGGEGAPSGVEEGPVSQGQQGGEQAGPAPIIEILGENPARLALGGSYTDLGAVITGPSDRERALTIHVFVNDEDVQSVSIPTNEAREWKVSYKVFSGGVVTTVERAVVVYDPVAEAAQDAAASSGSATSSESAPEPSVPQETPAEPATESVELEVSPEPAPEPDPEASTPQETPAETPAETPEPAPQS